MATYKPKRKTDKQGGIEEIKIPLSSVDGLQDSLNKKLDKTTYEYNKELSFGSTGKLLIGRFPCYDTNITVDINATTSLTYHGILVIATQNINTTGGGRIAATVYGDATNTIAPNIYLEYASGSRNVSVYFSPTSWSKNLIHIQAVNLQGAATDVVTKIDAIPATATIKPTNALTSEFAKKSELPNNYVTTDTDQTITATKIFNNGLYVTTSSENGETYFSASDYNGDQIFEVGDRNYVKNNSAYPESDKILGAVMIDSGQMGNVPLLLSTNSGTAGQVLTSQGPTKTPNWTTLGVAATKGVVTAVDTSSNLPTSNAVNESLKNKVTFVQNNGVNVAGNSKTTYKYNQSAIFAPNGLIMGGTAAAAGLVTRGICGVTTPNGDTGACSKENLYLNYDGNNTNHPNGRGVVINAGGAGTDLGHGIYSYCAVRGDAMKAWVEAKGYATLGTDGKVPTAQLPSYVDDVLEFANKAGFPTSGEAGKIYVAKDTNKTYRWSGTAYVEISASLALGETSSTAYAGDKGKANADAIKAIQNAGYITSSGSITGNAATATTATKLGTATKGGVSQPIYLNAGTPTNCDFTVADRSGNEKSDLNWTDADKTTKTVPTYNTLAYWNGAYNSDGRSNLTYCQQGAFGNSVIKSVVSVIDNSENLPTSKAVKTFVEGKGYLTSHQDISGKANLAGGNSFTGTQTLTSPSSGGYSINAAGYVKGSWLQAPSTGKMGSAASKVCVLDGSGWVYYRTPAEIIADAGGDKNTTYTLTRDGNDVVLTGSDGTTNKVNATGPQGVSITSISIVSA